MKLHLSDVVDQSQFFFGKWPPYHMAPVWNIHYHTCYSVWLLIFSTVEVWVNINMQSNYLPSSQVLEAGRQFVGKLELYSVSLHLISVEKVPGKEKEFYQYDHTLFISTLQSQCISWWSMHRMVICLAIYELVWHLMFYMKTYEISLESTIPYNVLTILRMTLLAEWNFWH